ncbi:MAG TPA: DUF6527 family protein, partial [Chitinophagaceae bacterium]|nr:DUF6527 family protein [Chitinophagaceae bacterium]
MKAEGGWLYLITRYAAQQKRGRIKYGNKVVTPIILRLTFDGKSVSLYPSVGNWNFPCKSNYWIKKNVIEHSYSWSYKEIENERKKDSNRKTNYFKWLQ